MIVPDDYPFGNINFDICVSAELKAQHLNPKKVTFIIPNLNSGGAERVVTILANAMVDQYKVAIITYIKTKPFYPLHPNINLSYCVDEVIPSKNFLHAICNNLNLLYKIIVQLQRNKPDLVVGFLTSANVLSALAAKFLGVKSLICERNNPEKEYSPKFWKLMRRLAYPLADGLTVQTHGVKNFYKDWIPVRKIFIVPNPLSDTITAMPVETSKEKIVLSVGRLSPQKSHELLIESFAKAKCTQDWTLIILGEGERRTKLEELIVSLGLEEKVKLPGRSKKIEDWYSKSSIFALTSRYEGFPNALIEAMYMKNSCVAMNCDYGPSELLNHGISGELVAYGDTTSFAASLDKLIKSKELRAKYGEAARLRASDFRVSKVIEVWSGIFSILIPK